MIFVNFELFYISNGVCPTYMANFASSSRGHTHCTLLINEMTKRKVLLLLAVVLVAAAAFFLYQKKNKSKDVVVAWDESYEGTDGMIAYLEKEYQMVNVMDNKFSNSFRLKQFLAKPIPKDPEKAADLMGSIAREYLNSGKLKEAIPAFEKYFSFVKENNLQPENYMFIKHLHALAYMRIGEIDNCYNRHTNESCIFPIQGTGVHAITEGSTQAIKIYKEILNETEPASVDYLVAQWLLNVAYMTLGRYPADVPAEYLIDPAKFTSSYDIKRFNDVAMQAGVAHNSLSGGVSMEDFNGDGYLDIVTSGWQFYETMKYFENNKNGTYTDKSAESGIAKLPGGLNMIHADYDNDGDADIFLLRGAWWDKFGCTPNSLLQNDGKGHFTDVTKKAGVLSFHPTNSARFEDFNNDGWLDLFIGNEASKGSPNHPCELYLNNQDGTFTEIAKKAGIAVKTYVKGVATGDYDNDGYVDIFLSVFQSGSNRLFRNTTAETGKLSFTETTKEAGISSPADCFPTWFVDYDNDGWLDLFVASFHNDYLYQLPAHFTGLPYDADYSALYHNNGDGTFTNIGEEAGFNQPVLAMGANYGDLDNDGYPDFYLATGNPDFRSLIPNLMFRNNAGKNFQDVTYSGGFGHLQKGHGVAFGDADMDGDQDIYEVLGGAIEGDFFNNVLFENPGHGNSWLTLFTEGVKSNKNAIGARIKITVADSTGNISTIHHVVGTGGSFGSNSLRSELGLGNAAEIKELEIQWPGISKSQKWQNLPVNAHVKVVEGKTAFEVMHFASFVFPPSMGHGMDMTMHAPM
jgi:hypothetical protein